jgi:transposase
MEAFLLISIIKKQGANDNEFMHFRCKSYKDCPHRWECSCDKRGRIISISVHHRAAERRRSKPRDPEKKLLIRLRKVIVEPLFAWIKQSGEFRRWTVSGIENVKAQWDLICAALNLKKLYRYWLKGELLLVGG